MCIVIIVPGTGLSSVPVKTPQIGFQQAGPILSIPTTCRQAVGPLTTLAWSVLGERGSRVGGRLGGTLGLSAYPLSLLYVCPTSPAGQHVGQSHDTYTSALQPPAMWTPGKEIPVNSVVHVIWLTCAYLCLPVGAWGSNLYNDYLETGVGGCNGGLG